MGGLRRWQIAGELVDKLTSRCCALGMVYIHGLMEDGVAWSWFPSLIKGFSGGVYLGQSTLSRPASGFSACSAR